MENITFSHGEDVVKVNYSYFDSRVIPFAYDLHDAVSKALSEFRKEGATGQDYVDSVLPLFNGQPDTFAFNPVMVSVEVFLKEKKKKHLCHIKIDWSLFHAIQSEIQKVPEKVYTKEEGVKNMLACDFGFDL